MRIALALLACMVGIIALAFLLTPPAPYVAAVEPTPRLTKQQAAERCRDHAMATRLGNVAILKEGAKCMQSYGY